MPAPLDCPEIASWEALFGDHIPPEQQELFEQHLESCAVCQARLDGSEASRDTLIHLVREVGGPDLGPADPTLSQVLDQLHALKIADQPAAGEPADLYFLHPSDQPGVLGTLGAYEVQAVIGQGGMGIVLKAFEPALHRLVAIKVMASAVAGSATARRRFTREAKAAAAVCHEHVVTVHGVHEADGLPYLVMQYIAGESVQDRLERSGPLELMDIVRIGMQTASGLAAAHAQGLIHRDIKPANLLLENGLAKVKITDFGLARTADDVQLTQNGVVAGTPEYMAPEQARGEPVDHRADLFSLGSVLYAMSTGVPPFRGTAALAVLRLVNDEAPAPPRSLNPGLPPWLDAFVARLMAKNPADRFQSAAEVAGLLEGYLAHLRQPATVPAPELPPTSPTFQTWKEEEPRKTRKTPAFRLLVSLSIGLLACLLLTALGLGIASQFGGAGAQSGSPPALAAEFHHNFRADQNNPILRVIGQGVRWEATGLRITLPAGQGILPNAGLAPDLSIHGDFDITLAYEILKADKPSTGYGVGVSLYVTVDPNFKDAVSLARRLLPDGKAVFMSDRMLPAAGDMQHIVQTRPSHELTGKLRLQRVGARVRFLVAEGNNQQFDQVDEVEFGTADVSYLQVGGNAGRSDSGLDLRLLDLSVRAESLPNLPKTPMVEGKGSSTVILLLVLMLSVSLGGWLFARHRRLLKTKPEHLSAKEKPATAPAGPLPLTFPCPACGKVLKVKAELAGKKVKCPSCSKPAVVPSHETTVSHDNQAENLPGGLLGRRLSQRSTLLMLAALAGLVLGAVLIAVVSGGTSSGTSPLAAAASGSGLPVRRLHGHTGPVRQVQFTPDGRRLVSASGWPGKDDSVRVWDPMSGQELLRIPTRGAVAGLDLSRDGKFALAGLSTGQVLYLNIETGQVLRFLRNRGSAGVSWVAFAADGRHAFSASHDGMAQLWDLAEGKEVRRFNTRGKLARFGAELPDGRRLLTVDDSGLLQLWEVATGQEVQQIEIGPGWICSLALTSDGRHALVGREDVSVWNLETRENLRVFEGHESQVHHMVLSPNSRWLLTAGFDGTVRLWDFQAGELLRVLGSHEEFAFAAVFSPDGQLVASGGGGRRDDGNDFQAGKDHDIRLWDITSLPTDLAAKPVVETKLPLTLSLSLLFAIILALCVWLYGRQRWLAKDRTQRSRGTTPGKDRLADGQTAVPLISFACAECGKNLKARGELAGKKVKCPSCGKAAIVPGEQPQAPAEESRVHVKAGPPPGPEETS